METMNKLLIDFIIDKNIYGFRNILESKEPFFIDIPEVSQLKKVPSTTIPNNTVHAVIKLSNSDENENDLSINEESFNLAKKVQGQVEFNEQFNKKTYSTV